MGISGRRGRFYRAFFRAAHRMNGDANPAPATIFAQVCARLEHADVLSLIRNSPRAQTTLSAIVYGSTPVTSWRESKR
jgi:hypothetical protein